MANSSVRVDKHVAISGAGLAGLATAASFAQRGWDVSVYERAEELREFGAGIWLWPNGLAALRHIGAKDAFDTFEHRDVTGWRIRDVARSQQLNMPVWPVCVAHRQYLYKSLLDRCEALNVKFTTGMTSDYAEPEGTIRFADGNDASAELIVAADGVNSRIASKGKFVKRRSESTAIGARMLVPRSLLPALTICDENWNHSRTLLVTPVDDHWTYLYVGTSIEDEEAITQDRERKTYLLNKNVWKDSFPEYAPLLDHIPESIRWDRFVVTTPRHWSVGRVAAVGDAIHAITPALGQAGNLAMVNGAALGEIVSNAVAGGRSIIEGLSLWEESVAPQTDWTRMWCNGYSKVSYFFPPALSRWRMGSMSRVLSSQPVERRLTKATSIVPESIA